MGDAGSAFLGAFYGMQSVVDALSTPVPLPVLVLPFANFILDTTFTLFRRLIRRVTSIELLVVGSPAEVFGYRDRREPLGWKPFSREVLATHKALVQRLVDIR